MVIWSALYKYRQMFHWISIFMGQNQSFFDLTECLFLMILINMLWFHYLFYEGQHTDESFLQPLCGSQASVWASGKDQTPLPSKCSVVFIEAGFCSLIKPNADKKKKKSQICSWNWEKNGWNLGQFYDAAALDVWGHLFSDIGCSIDVVKYTELQLVRRLVFSVVFRLNHWIVPLLDAAVKL